MRKKIKKKYSSYRGKSYFMGMQNEKYNNKCIFTGWECSHLLLHVLLGYYYNIYVSLGISVGYEVYEYINYKCHSVFDLGIDFTGFIIGSSIRCYFK